MCIKYKILNWYRPHDRSLPWRHTKKPYAIWVSEIMLQQTQATTVIPYYERFMETFPTVDDLALGDEEVLLKLWQGLGYYRRARNLKKAALVIHEKGMPQTFEGLRELPGIGDYTAAAIASIAFDEPVAAVDGNLLRIYSRLYCVDDVIDRSKGKNKIFALANEDISRERPGDFNQAMMDLGNKVCTPENPLCLLCPLRDDCAAFKEGRVAELPKKTPKKKQTFLDYTLLLLDLDDSFLLEKRETGLLHGMWGFPLIENHLKTEDVQKYLTERNVMTRSVENRGSYRHIFSHRIWNITIVYAKVDALFAKEESGLWVDKKELERYAIPSAFQPALEVIHGLD